MSPKYRNWDTHNTSMWASFLFPTTPAWPSLLKTCTLFSLSPGWYFVVPNWRAGLWQLVFTSHLMCMSFWYTKCSLYIFPFNTPPYSCGLSAKKHLTHEVIGSQRSKMTSQALRKCVVRTWTLSPQAQISFSVWNPLFCHRGWRKALTPTWQIGPGLKLKCCLFHYDSPLCPGSGLSQPGFQSCSFSHTGNVPWSSEMPAVIQARSGTSKFSLNPPWVLQHWKRQKLYPEPFDQATSIWYTVAHTENRNHKTNPSKPKPINASPKDKWLIINVRCVIDTT